MSPGVFYGVGIEYARETVNADLVESLVAAGLDHYFDPYIGQPIYEFKRKFTDHSMFRGMGEYAVRDRVDDGGYKGWRSQIEGILEPPVNPIK